LLSCPLPQGGPGAAGPSVDSEMSTHLRQKIAELKQRTLETGAELDRCKQDQEAFSVEYYTFRERNLQFETFVQQHGDQHPDVKKHKASKETMEKTIKQKVREQFL